MGQIKKVDRVGRYITVESAVKRSGFSRSFINYLAQVGHVSAIKFSDCIGIEMASLDEYIASRRKSVEQRSGEE